MRGLLSRTVATLSRGPGKKKILFIIALSPTVAGVATVAGVRAQK